MQWQVTASLAVCGGTLVGVLGLLALTSYYVYDGDKNIPSETSDDWMIHVIALIPITVVFALSSIYAIWVILSRNRKWFFVGLLIWNAVCLCVGLYFTVAFSLELDKPKVESESLFNKTNTTIQDHFKQKKNQHKFIPIWLDNIQNKSKECCGIRTFRDWELLWPKASSELPKSCCKEPENAEKCKTNSQSLPYPKTTSDFLKTDTGCIGEINTFIRKNIHDCWVYMIIVCILYILSEIFYIVQFYYSYGKASDNYADDSQPPGSSSSGGSGFFGNMRLKKKKRQTDAEAAKESGDLYGISDVASGSLTNASNMSGSQGTLPDGSQSFQDQMASASSSGSDLEDDAPADGTKKKRRKRRKKNKAESGVGSEDGNVNRQEVFVVPDNTYDYNQPDDLLAANGYDSSPTGSQDEVGDKLAPGARPNRNVLGVVGGGATTVGKGIASGATTVGKGVVGGAAFVGKGMVSGASTVGQGVASGATTLGKGVVGGATFLEKGAVSGATFVGKGVVSGATAVGQGVASGATTVGQGVVSGATTVGKGASSAGQTIAHGASVAAHGVATGLKKVGSGIGSGFGKLAHSFQKKGNSSGQGNASDPDTDAEQQ